MNLFEKLSAAEAKRLGAFLESVACPANTMTLMELKGFLFALCCAPANTRLSQWMPEVFNQRSPNYANAEEADFVTGALARLYNANMAEVSEGSSHLPAACKFREPVTDNFKSGSPLHEWSSGFNAGYLFMYDAWDRLIAGDEELIAAVGYMVLTLGFFDDIEESGHLINMAFDIDLPLSDTAPVVRGQMPQVMKEFARIGRSLLEDSQEHDVLPGSAKAAVAASTSKILPFKVPHALDDAQQRLERADALVLEVLAETDFERRVAVARKALSISEDCVRAYTLLADEAAEDIGQSADYYRKALAAGERVHSAVSARAVDPQPYLEALLGYAEILVEDGHLGEAIECLKKALELDPDDSMDVRYLLALRYIDAAACEQAAALIHRYRDDTPWWLFTESLLAWIANGDVTESRQLATRAIAANKMVPQYLAGKRRMPRTLPSDIVVGSRDEAVVYAHEARATWQRYPGAIEWLVELADKLRKLGDSEDEVS